MAICPTCQGTGQVPDPDREITYVGLLKEFMAGVEDRDHLNFVWKVADGAYPDRNPVYLAYCVGADNPEWVATTHKALDTVSFRLRRYRDEDLDPERVKGREALSIWLRRLSRLINPNFTSQEIWGGNGRPGLVSYFRGFGEEVASKARAAPEPLRGTLLQLIAESNRWWLESEQERMAEPR